MKLHDVLWQSAATLTSRQTVRRVQIYAEIGRRQAYPITDRIAQEITSLEAEADNCAQAFHRLGAFRPDKEPTCPHCWIVQGERSPVVKSSQPDLYRCARCEAEYSVAPLPPISASELRSRS